ncbi:hypothetical protein ABPG75_009216 [Micractinium tetrahymenae]
MDVFLRFNSYQAERLACLDVCAGAAFALARLLLCFPGDRPLLNAGVVLAPLAVALWGLISPRSYTRLRALPAMLCRAAAVWSPSRRGILRPLRVGVLPEWDGSPGPPAALRLLLWSSGILPILAASLAYPLPLCLMLPLQFGLVGGLWGRAADICGAAAAAEPALQRWAAAAARAVHPLSWVLLVPHPAVPLPADPCTALVHWLQLLLAGALPAFLVAALECKRFQFWSAAVVASSYLPPSCVHRFYAALEASVDACLTGWRGTVILMDCAAACWLAACIAQWPGLRGG